MKKIKFIIFLGFGCLLIFTGCSTKGKLFREFKKTKKNKGIIYFYRSSSVKGYFIKYPIFNKNTNKTLGNLKNGSYFYTEMTEGVHTIGTYTNSMEIEITKNSLTCIRVYADIDLIWRPYVPYLVLEKVSQHICKNEIATTREL